MPRPWEVTQPSYTRNGVNTGASAITIAKILKRTSSEQGVDLATSASDAIAGVSVEDLPVGITRSVQVDGVAIVTAGDAIAIGDKLTTDSVGRAVPVATTSDSVVGVALQVASAAGQTISVELTKSGSGSNSNVFKRTKTVAAAEFTEPSGASQSFAMGGALPVGARPIGYQIITGTAPAGPTGVTYTAQIGVTGTLGKYATGKSLAATGSTGATLVPLSADGEQLYLTIVGSTGPAGPLSAGGVTAEVLFAVP